MGRIIAFDIGKKRTGIAVTDPLKIIASPFNTLPTDDLFPFLFKYLVEENVEKAVVGYPLNLNGTPTDNTARVEKFIKRFNKEFPQIPLSKIDEAYTSKLASQTMVEAGIKKKDRQKKENIDKIAAAIILQQFLEDENLSE